MAHLHQEDKSAQIMQLEKLDTAGSGSDDKLDFVPGYGHERDPRAVADIESEDNPNVHQSVRTTNRNHGFTIIGADVVGLDEYSAFSIPRGDDVSMGRLTDSSLPVWRVRLLFHETPLKTPQALHRF